MTERGVERDRERIQDPGRTASTPLRLHDYAIHRILVRPPIAAQSLDVSEPTAYKAVARLEQLGILREITGKSWGKIYAYTEYLAILNEGTEREPDA